MKYIGCILILIGAAGAGIYASAQLEKRKRQLSSLRRTILLIEREIDYQLSPLSESMVLAAKKADKPWDVVFHNFSQVLIKKNSPREEIDVLMKQEIKKAEVYHPWKKDLEILMNLVKGLGQLDKAMQLAQLKMAEADILQAEQEALEEHKKKSQLYRTLGLCIGVLGVIILI